ncbi:MAG: hypothetical protein ACFFEY_01485 [Candidatus Thorarchaeota archaeon]
MFLKLKKKKFEDLRLSFAKRYRICNRCETSLDIENDEEIVCLLCGETFCSNCISNHQKYCYDILN